MVKFVCCVFYVNIMNSNGHLTPRQFDKTYGLHIGLKRALALRQSE